jgi:hypothetical protein
MDPQMTRQSVMDKDQYCAYLWTRVAQWKYRFDLLTAQRLAFTCWLRLTGRLSDWSS